MSDQNDLLSERELEILRLVATGAANKEIAQELVISPNTVKVHLRNIFAKLGVSSRTEATLYAVQNGLVNPNRDVDAPIVEEEDEEEPLPAASPQTSGEPPVQPAISAQPRSRPKLIRWMALALLAAVVLIAAGTAGARWLFPTSPPAPTSVQSAEMSQAGRWLKMAALPTPRKGMAAVEYNNGLYLIGGETAQGLDGALLHYDPQSNLWQSLAAKPTPVTDIRAVLIGEKIYIPGGRLPDGKPTSRFEVYDPRQNTWEQKAALPIPLSGYSLVPFEGHLFLFGGKDSQVHYAAGVYEYDPQADQWTERTPMRTARAYAGAAVEDEKIYLIGGFDGQEALTLNETYFPTRDANGENPWETNTPMPEGHYAMGVANLASVIYLLGGMDQSGQSTGPARFEYLPRSDSWAEFEAPPQPVGAFTAMVGSGSYIHVFGGETSTGLLDTHQLYQAIYTISIPVIREDNSPDSNK